MRPKSDWKGCPVRYAAGVLGDPWTLVLLRDLLFKGKRHFREFLAEESPATNVLADRLAGLESTGIIARRRDPERGNQVICELTEKGLALVPMFLAMIDWSATYDAETEVPAEFVAGYRADSAAFAQELVRTLNSAPPGGLTPGIGRRECVGPPEPDTMEKVRRQTHSLRQRRHSP